MRSRSRTNVQIKNFFQACFGFAESDVQTCKIRACTIEQPYNRTKISFFDLYLLRDKKGGHLAGYPPFLC